MKKFDNGVTYYTMATVNIPFPENDVCCHWCPLLGKEVISNRDYCKRTGEFLVSPKDIIGCQCPLEFITEARSDNG